MGGPLPEGSVMMHAGPCTIFIPLFNEEEIIERNVLELLRYMRGQGIECEIILGSNGSTDRTPTVIQGLAQRLPNVRAFHLEGRGPGRAFCRAVEMASHEYIVSQDADLAVDLGFIPLALSLLDMCEIVIGCKRMSVQNRSFFRKLGSNAFIFAAAVLLDVGAADFSIGAKAYRKGFVLSHLGELDAGTAYVLELVYRAATGGHRVIEVPVACSDTRRSKFNLGAEAYHKFSHLFRFAWRERSKRTKAKEVPRR
jgi:glycosyltransferase involved in cell wall biosynthesis